MKGYLLAQPGEGQYTIYPLVGEINDSLVSEMRTNPVKVHHVRAALNTVT